MDSEKALKYYVKDTAANKVYTNIGASANLDDYINREAVHVDKFPVALGIRNNFQITSSWFQKNNLEGTFIFVKSGNSLGQMMQDYNYYSSIRERLIKEVFIGIASLLTGIILFIFLKLRFGQEEGNSKSIRNLYKKIPLDLRVFIFIVYGFIMCSYLSHVSFFYTPVEVKHFQRLSAAALYVYYLMLSLGSALRLIQNKEEFTAQLQKCVFYQIGLLWQEGRKFKETLFREVSLFAFTGLFGVAAAVGVLSLQMRYKILFLAALIYIVLYIPFFSLYLLRRAAVINRIIEGTDAIASGNLNYIMEETGNNSYKTIARNINSMKDSFKKSVEDQVRSERLKTELITNVSHDLRTPLTSIINYVSLLKKDNVPIEESKKYIEVLDQKSQRLKVLIEDLFEASKVSSGSIELVIERIDIAALLRQALGEFDEKISKSPLTFKSNIPVEKVFLNLDGKRTWRVFENLIGNALKYSQPDSRVYIDLIEKETTVDIIIKNMSSYELNFDVNEIFERSKRGDKARSTEGSGLGLSIAKSIVELQGGHMKIDIDGDLFKVTTTFEKAAG